MTRLKDIAEIAGVSIMTVSKALRDAPDISAATKGRIKALAEKMGYVPDTMAQGMRAGTSKLFGLLISATTNPIYARMVMAIEEQAHELGYEVLLAHTLNDPGREEQCIRRFLARRIDGLFITPVYRLQQTARVYEELVRHNIPTVVLGQTTAACRSFSNVEVDDLAASCAATRHLIELGHKRIAFLTGPQASPWSQERFEGYRRALAESQMNVDERLVFQAGSTIEEGRKAALEMLNENPGATAIQGVNDLVAMGAASVFLDQGIKIPRDISVVGFGNILTAEHFRVPLTTVRQPKFRLGVAAVELMQGLLRGENPSSRRLSAEIIARASTAEPPR